MTVPVKIVIENRSDDNSGEGASAQVTSEGSRAREENRRVPEVETGTREPLVEEPYQSRRHAARQETPEDRAEV